MSVASSLVEAALKALGRHAVSLDPQELQQHAWDALGPGRGYRGFSALQPKPRLLVKPKSSEDVAAAVRFAATEGLAVVPYGGGSGLMGGAIPLEPSLVIDLREMAAVMEISPADRTVRVQAGAVLSDLEARLSAQSLMLGHDPWSLPIATVGGAISTDSLGYRGAQYGSMGDQVLGLTAVLPDGRIVRTPAAQKASTGLDLKRLFIGTEGCFGIVTEAVLRVFPQPESRALSCFRFPTFEDGFAAAQEMFGLGLTPAVLDYGEAFSPEPLRELMRAWGPRNAFPTLYLGFEGFREGVTAQRRRAAQICRGHGGVRRPQKEALDFWRERHSIAERFSRSRADRGSRPQAGGPGFRVDYAHVALPASRVLAYRERCREIAARSGVYPLEFGLWCRPELFSVVIAQPPGSELSLLEEALDQILRAAQEMGGAMEYCHGVGLRLAHLMVDEHGSGLEVMRAIKQTLDPQNILNPGKLAL